MDCESIGILSQYIYYNFIGENFLLQQADYEIKHSAFGQIVLDPCLGNTI